jgi:hypothetical protein
MIRDWMNRRRHAAAATALAERFVERVGHAGSDTRRDERKRERAVESLVRELNDYARRERLGIYGKAKLCKAVEYHLLGQAFDRVYVDALVHKLVRRVSV